MKEVLAVSPVGIVLTCASLLALLFMCSTHWNGKEHLCLVFSDWDQGGEVWCQHLPLQFEESWSLAERVQHDGPLKNRVAMRPQKRDHLPPVNISVQLNSCFPKCSY